MRQFVYIDRNAGAVTHSVMYQTLGREKYGAMVQVHAGEILFECEASDILEADAQFLKATGRIPTKGLSVCVSIRETKP